MVDRLCALEGVQADIAMMRTPDSHSRIELTKYHSPKLVEVKPAIAPANTLGLRQIMFEVDDINDTITRMRAHGAELIGEVVDYENIYTLCYLRGPAGVIIALAEQL
jgi:hypothetical protein